MTDLLQTVAVIDIEERLACFHDTKKELLYLKADGWGWADQDDAENPDSYHTGFSTAWEAICDATLPYFEDWEE